MNYKKEIKDAIELRHSIDNWSHRVGCYVFEYGIDNITEPDSFELKLVSEYHAHGCLFERLVGGELQKAIATINYYISQITRGNVSKDFDQNDFFRANRNLGNIGWKLDDIYNTDLYPFIRRENHEN